MLDFKAKAFSCPHCGTNTKHKWYYLAKGGITEKGFNYYVGFVPDLNFGLCVQCNNFTLWLNEKLIYPSLFLAPKPTEDMPISVKKTFLEARKIVEGSPRAASALLRLSIQKLIKHLGEKSRNLETAVSNLIEKGLSNKFYDALLAVRILGKKAVKPGVINSKDDINTAIALFILVNMLVESTISQQRKVNQLYTSLPKPKPVKRKKRIQRKKTTTIKKRAIIPKPTILYR
jgi:hypothetical protein